MFSSCITTSNFAKSETVLACRFFLKVTVKWCGFERSGFSEVTDRPLLKLSDANERCLLEIKR